jgi:dihydrofolate reductase
MKLTTTTQVSVDGVIQGPGGPEEDERGVFERGGWAHFDNEAGTAMDEIFQRADAFLFGRRTYEIFASSWGAWPDPGNSPIWKALHTQPKYVAATTVREPRWANTTVLSGDLAAAVRELKAKPGRELQQPGPLAVPQPAGRRDHPAHLSRGRRPGNAAVPRHRPRHSARPDRLAGHPPRGDDPALPAHRAPAVRDGHGRLKHATEAPPHGVPL